jgi:glycosyltransferase involved in cell wall biosynthesis
MLKKFKTYRSTKLGKMPIKRKFSRLPISVFIIAKNEEDRIPYAINSVIGWVDEVIVVDSGSTDKTVEVAKKLGSTQVVFNQWQGYGIQKAYGESLCKNNWILNIDADEEITPELKDEIIELFKSDPEHAAYYMTVKITPRFSVTPPVLGPEDVVIRLYDKTKANYDTHTIHDTVKVKKGTSGKLKHYVLHRCFRSYSHAIDKINFYTTMQAEDMMKKNRCPLRVRVILEPFFAFIKSYFINKLPWADAHGFSLGQAPLELNLPYPDALYSSLSPSH